jgi:hypothetical protein
VGSLPRQSASPERAEPSKGAPLSTSISHRAHRPHAGRPCRGSAKPRGPRAPPVSGQPEACRPHRRRACDSVGDCAA